MPRSLSRAACMPLGAEGSPSPAFLMPYQVPPLVLALGFKTFSHAQATKALLLLAALTALLILPATVLYWSLLGVL